MRSILILILILGLFVSPALAVDGVLEINQSCAVGGGCLPGDSSGFPVKISASGSYRLTSNLTVTDPLQSGISIEAENVALDLNGFVITGAGSGFPRGVISLEDNVSVSNGTVRSMYNGLHLQGEGARVERMYLLGNIASGALVGAGATVSNNTITGNGSSGISAQASCLITHNSIRDGGSDGISTGSGCTVTGNTLSDNAGFGVNFNSAFSGYGDNVLTGNNGGSANDQVKFGAEIGTNICGFDTVCP